MRPAGPHTGYAAVKSGLALAAFLLAYGDAGALAAEAVHSIPFVRVAQCTGGTQLSPSLCRSEYLNAAGIVQRTEEREHLVLKLQEGRADTTGFLKALDADPSRLLPASPVSTDSGIVEEAWEDFTEVSYATSSHPSTLKAYKGKEQENIAGLLSQVSALTKAAAKSAAPGLYARASLMPHYFEDYPATVSRAQLVNGVLTPEDLGDARLRSLMEHENALMRLGDTDKSLLLGKSLTLTREKPLHVQWGEEAYHIAAYFYSGGSAEGASSGPALER